jgi:hypothetical protein
MRGACRAQEAATAPRTAAIAADDPQPDSNTRYLLSVTTFQRYET